jgi:hypothetical protein
VRGVFELATVLPYANPGGTSIGCPADPVVDAGIAAQRGARDAEPCDQWNSRTTQSRDCNKESTVTVKSFLGTTGLGLFLGAASYVGARLYAGKR